MQCFRLVDLVCNQVTECLLQTPGDSDSVSDPVLSVWFVFVVCAVVHTNILYYDIAKCQLCC